METSITVKNTGYVIDPGVRKIPTEHNRHGTHNLRAKFGDGNAMEQRKGETLRRNSFSLSLPFPGRVGRVDPGAYIYLLSMRRRHEQSQKDNVEMLLRSSYHTVRYRNLFLVNTHPHQGTHMLKLLHGITPKQLIYAHPEELCDEITEELMNMVCAPVQIPVHLHSTSQGMVDEENPAILNEYGTFYTVQFSFMDPHLVTLLLFGAAGRNTLAACALVAELSTGCPVLRAPSRSKFFSL